MERVRAVICMRGEGKLRASHTRTCGNGSSEAEPKPWLLLPPAAGKVRLMTRTGMLALRSCAAKGVCIGAVQWCVCERERVRLMTRTGMLALRSWAATGVCIGAVQVSVCVCVCAVDDANGHVGSARSWAARGVCKGAVQRCVHV